jgi:hypothetical protein
MRRFEFCDLPIQLPKLHVIAINELLGFFFGGLIVGANNIDAILNMPVRAQWAGARRPRKRDHPALPLPLIAT